MKVLVVVDMQNDFIDGALANPAAQKIVEPIAKYIKNFDGELILLTADTHYDDYLQTYEGKHLPIPHCIQGTDGWKINDSIWDAVTTKNTAAFTLTKGTFGAAVHLTRYIKTQLRAFNVDQKDLQIEFVGTCTDICVLSNVIGIKEHLPEAEIIVHENLCAGLTEEKHKAALEVMRSCQVSVINTYASLKYAGLKEFIKQCLPSSYFDENWTLSKHIASDIGYEIKHDIEQSRFNAVSATDNCDYEVVFDEWYNFFLEDAIIPILIELGAIPNED